MKNKISFSKLQTQAIYAPIGQNLISAGAGSGKTAVLTARIIRLLQDGVSLQQLIVLTFTNAAAQEMKERVRKELQEASLQENQHLKEQLANIDQANIQTFDAFSLSIVKRYHYLLGFPKAISIADSVLLTKLRKECVDKVFLSYYENKDQRFFALLEAFAKKEDTDLQHAFNSILQQVSLLVDSKEFLDVYPNVFLEDTFIQRATQTFLEYLQETLKDIKVSFKELYSLVQSGIGTKHLQIIDLGLSDLYNAKSYESIKEALQFTFPRIDRNIPEDEKNIIQDKKKYLKSILEGLQKLCDYDSLSAIKLQLKHTFSFQEIVLEMLKKIYDLFEAKKQSENLYDFMDIAKAAIRLFQDYPWLQEEYQNSIAEILIDEYQDTSDLQDALISLIAKHNVYMVGDVKQSIYRFRYANPAIFQEKFVLFQNSKNSSVIELSENYRSREEVIRGINSLFSNIMSKEMGGVAYVGGQHLAYGNKTYETKDNKSRYGIYSLTYHLDETYQSYKNYEIEAFIIANEIKKRVENKEQVMGKKGLRDAKWNDFAILTQDKGKFGLFKQIFEYMQIPLSIHKTEPFMLSDEIFVTKNILRLVWGLKNKAYYKDFFKESLVSVLRSFIIEEEDRIITKIANLDPLVFLESYRKDVYDTLQYLHQYADQHALSELIREIYVTFAIFAKLPKIGNVSLLENKLLFFQEKARLLEEAGHGLVDFIEYLEWIIEESIDLEFEEYNDINRNAVQMMSIHKSKGLEFPICFYPLLGQSFQIREARERILLSKEYGMILPSYENELLRSTVLKHMFQFDSTTEAISEKIRLFYVALTRAKEQAIFIHPQFTLEDSIAPTRENISKSRSFMDFLKQNAEYVVMNAQDVFLSNIPISNKYKKAYQTQDLLDAPSFAYTYQEQRLQKEEIVQSKSSMVVQDVFSKVQRELIQTGNLLHEVLQYLDFNKNIYGQLDSYNLSPQLKEQISQFFNAPFLAQQEIVDVYKEHAFILQKEDQMIQGSIDLIIETPTQMIVVDYKLEDIHKRSYQTQVQHYMAYLLEHTKKEVIGFLYSITTGKFLKVEL